MPDKRLDGDNALYYQLVDLERRAPDLFRDAVGDLLTTSSIWLPIELY